MNGEFLYSRSDSGVTKEFSVDIDAETRISSSTQQQTNSCHLKLLVECKYRAPNIKWLFLPDPNSFDDSLLSKEIHYA